MEIEYREDWEKTGVQKPKKPKRIKKFRSIKQPFILLPNEGNKKNINIIACFSAP
jgi:hypothetical protein